MGCSPIWAADFIVIANPDVPVSTLSTEELSDIYLLRATIWENDIKIVPVNREVDSNIRTAFSARVLKQPQSSLADYWNKMHYKGMTPPLTQESDQAVLAFVQKVPGAIGYVSSSIPLKNVKVLIETR